MSSSPKGGAIDMVSIRSNAAAVAVSSPTKPSGVTPTCCCIPIPSVCLRSVLCIPCAAGHSKWSQLPLRKQTVLVIGCVLLFVITVPIWSRLILAIWGDGTAPASDFEIESHPITLAAPALAHAHAATAADAAVALTDLPPPLPPHGISAIAAADPNYRPTGALPPLPASVNTPLPAAPPLPAGSPALHRLASAAAPLTPLPVNAQHRAGGGPSGTVAPLPPTSNVRGRFEKAIARRRINVGIPHPATPQAAAQRHAKAQAVAHRERTAEAKRPKHRLP